MTMMMDQFIEEDGSGDDYYETSQQQILETSSLSNSGQAIYKEVNLSLKFSNRATSDAQTSRKVDQQVQEPKILPSARSNTSKDCDQPSAILERSYNRIRELSSLLPAKTNDLSPKESAKFQQTNMESDLKSLQQKIMDLESKLSFTHTALEEEPTSMFDLKKNVKFDTQAFDSLNEEVTKFKAKPEVKKPKA